MSSFTIKPKRSVKEFDFWLLKISFGVLLVVLGLFLIVSVVFSATIFTDDFNSYYDGNLDAQGSWTGSIYYDVQDTLVYEGAKAIKIIAPGGEGNQEINKSGSKLSTGRISYYIQAGQTNKTIQVQLMEDTTYSVRVVLASSGNWGYEDDGGWHDTGTPYSADTWYLVEIEWQETGGTNPQFRFRINNGGWHGWYDCSTDWVVGLEAVRLLTSATESPATAYFDYIAENPIRFFDDFDTYDLGNLVGQGTWLNDSGSDNYVQVVDDVSKSGDQSIYLVHQTPNIQHSVYKKGYNACEDSIGFWFYMVDSVPGNQDEISVLTFGEPNAIARVYIGGDDLQVRGRTLDGYEVLGTIENDIWYSVDMEWDCNSKKVRYNFNKSGWTDWKTNYSDSASLVERIIIYHQFKGTAGLNDFYIDRIAETSELPCCNLENCDLCLEWFECQVVGCCWYYQPWYPPPLDNYCDVCEGECSYPYNCGLCETETTCEFVGCFWTGDYCTQFEWECGGELACQFCDTQETCEAEECNWNAPTETCWYVAPTLPSSWGDYYSEHGGYPTSSVFVNELAETSGGTFIFLSGLFEGFITSFNTADALAKGSAMGNVIPKGRGYLKIFDGLFGHYPIGETFVFILIFILAIGLFRVARQLIQLIKP